MSASPVRSVAQSPVPRAWAQSAPLPSIKEKPVCDRCHMAIIEEIIKLKFNGTNFDFCSRTCLKIWIFKVIK